MSGGSSSDWWEGWSGTYHGWQDSSSSDPTPTEQAPNEQVANAIHRLQDRLQQMLAMTQRRSHKTGTERAASTAKGNAAYAAMEAVIMAREWQAEAKRAYDQKFVKATEVEETYHDAIRRTLEKTEALEKHVKTVTMRADSLAINEADFFQTLIEHQEETIRELNTLYGQLCQPRPTQWCPCTSMLESLFTRHSSTRLFIGTNLRRSENGSSQAPRIPRTVPPQRESRGLSHATRERSRVSPTRSSPPVSVRHATQ